MRSLRVQRIFRLKQTQHAVAVFWTMQERDELQLSLSFMSFLLYHPVLMVAVDFGDFSMMCSQHLMKQSCKHLHTCTCTYVYLRHTYLHAICNKKCISFSPLALSKSCSKSLRDLPPFFHGSQISSGTSSFPLLALGQQILESCADNLLRRFVSAVNAWREPPAEARWHGLCLIGRKQEEVKSSRVLSARHSSGIPCASLEEYTCCYRPGLVNLEPASLHTPAKRAAASLKSFLSWPANKVRTHKNQAH